MLNWDMRPTWTRIWITVATAIVTMFWNRDSIVSGDVGSAVVGALAGTVVGYLAAPGVEYAWASRNRSGDLDRGVILAAGGVAAVLGSIVYPWITGQHAESWAITLFVLLVAGCAEVLVRVRRRLKST